MKRLQAVQRVGTAADKVAAQGTTLEESALGPSTQQPQHPQRNLTALEARERMRDAVEPEAHPIAGVSFKGRQETVQKLKLGGTIVLCLSSAGRGTALCQHAASLPQCYHWQEIQRAAISILRGTRVRATADLLQQEVDLCFVQVKLSCWRRIQRIHLTPVPSE